MKSIVLFSVLILVASVFLYSSYRSQNSVSISSTEAVNTSQESFSTIEKLENPYYSRTDTNKLTLTDAQWKKVLSPDLYAVSREKDTERPFTGKYWEFSGKGTYYCSACGFKLFRSDAKFASSCGWPSFFEQENLSSVVYEIDKAYGMERTEALCGRCEGHLGHLFDDGPKPTGKRYCMNSICLDFVADH